ncbi:MAG: RDD family protein [Clostridia bacterium]|nr:RDD family protein [Clostridia bacterium]
MTFDLQKANMWKRISAFILDIILVCVVSTGAMLVLSAITGYDNYSEKLNGFYSSYEEQYNIESFDIAEEEYNNLSKKERDTYDKAYKALISDDEVLYTYSMVINLTMLITSLGILLTFLLLEFVIPLLFGNGQTVGKKIFGLCLVRRDGVKVNTLMLFVRTFLGKYTVETMIPLLLIIMLFFGSVGVTGLIVIGLIFLLQIILIFSTENRTAIHDAFSQTVVTDMASQMIFDSYEELLAYKKKEAAEKAQRETY